MTSTADHQPNAHDASLAGARAWFAERGLSRPREGRILAGVVAVLTFTPIVYVVAWLLMPADAETVAAPVAAGA